MKFYIDETEWQQLMDTIKQEDHNGCIIRCDSDDCNCFLPSNYLELIMEKMIISKKDFEWLIFQIEKYGMIYLY